MSEFGIFWGTEIYNYEDSKSPIIEHLLYEDDVLCISSEAGVGKSILALQLIFSLTSQEPFLDTYAVKKKCRVLYVQTEGDRSETLERIGNMKKALSIDDGMWTHINLAGLMLNLDDKMNEFITLAKISNMEYDVIIIDPLYTTVKGSMIKDEIATDWVRNIRKLKGIFDASLIVLHHDNKAIYHEGRIIDRGNKNIFGSVFWGAFFNQNYKLKSWNNIHTLEIGKSRSGKMTDKLEMKLLEPSPLMFTLCDDELDLSTARVIAVLKKSEKPMSPMEVQKAIDMSRATAFRALAKLVATERAIKTFEGNNTFYELKKL